MSLFIGNNMAQSKSQKAGKGLVDTFRKYSERFVPFVETVKNKLLQLYTVNLKEKDDGTSYLDLSESDAKAFLGEIQNFINYDYLEIPEEQTARTEEGRMEVKSKLAGIAGGYLDFKALSGLLGNLTPESIVSYGEKLGQNFAQRVLNNAVATVPESEIREVLKGVGDYQKTLPTDEAKRTLEEAGYANILSGLESRLEQ